MIEVGRTWKFGAMGILLLASAVSHGAEVRVFAAGSLRLALDDAIAAYAERTGVQVIAVYGPSGKLRQMIEGGDVPDLFLSASIEHTAALQRAGVLRTSAPFTRNSLCLMAAPGISLERGKVVEVMLEPSLRLGTSTPKTDPAGDYTWEMFRKVDNLRPGAYATLDAKALRLTGKDVAKEDKALPYPALFQGERSTDLFVSYCTNAVATARAVPGLTWQRLPDDIDVAAVYGAGVSTQASSASEGFLRFLESAGWPQDLRALRLSVTARGCPRFHENRGAARPVVGAGVRRRRRVALRSDGIRWCVRRPRHARPVPRRLHHARPRRPVWHAARFRGRDDRLRTLLSHPFPGAADEGDRSGRDHERGPWHRAHQSERGLRGGARHRADLARARTHRARESGRAHHGAAGGAGHRARPGVLLHARRHRDGRERVDARRGWRHRDPGASAESTPARDARAARRWGSG